jgi:hypothetical protein
VAWDRKARVSYPSPLKAGTGNHTEKTFRKHDDCNEIISEWIKNIPTSDVDVTQMGSVERGDFDKVRE